MKKEYKKIYINYILNLLDNIEISKVSGDSQILIQNPNEKIREIYVNYILYKFVPNLYIQYSFIDDTVISFELKFYNLIYYKIFKKIHILFNKKHFDNLPATKKREHILKQLLK